MTQRLDLDQFSADQLCALATELFHRVDTRDRALVRSNAIIEKLTHEVAILKRHKYARRSEQLNTGQGLLLGELIASDLAAIEAELGQAMTDERKAGRPKQQPKRAPLPAELPRVLIHLEPEDPQCRCGRRLKRMARTSAKSWTTYRASSRWSVTSGARGPVTRARHQSRHRCHRR